MGKITKYFLLCLSLMFASIPADAQFRGTVEAQFDYFSESPLFDGQSNDRLQPSLKTELNFYEDITDEAAIGLSVFGKYHPHAEQELSGDVREAWIGFYNNQSEWHAGILTEHWGVLEAENIVDIINPRDAVEDFQGDVKLGIPGVSFAYLADAGRISLWLLPYAREPRLAEGADRFRTVQFPLKDGRFENGRDHIALAARGSTGWDNFELSLSHFYGHSRYPRFTPETNAAGQPVALIPFYDVINQTGVEGLWDLGSSLWKLETFFQQHPEDNFFGIGIGVEREIPKLWKSNASLTLYAEAYYDDRAESPSVPMTPFQKDVFLGTRIALNDIKSTELQVRVTYDLEYDSALLDIRAGRRLGKNWGIEARFDSFLNAGEDPALSSFRNDDRIQFRLIRSF